MTAPGGSSGPELMSAAGTAALLQVSRSTVRRWADSGRLSFIRTPSGQRRYRRPEVTALAARAGHGLLSTGAVAHMFRVAPGTVIRWADKGLIGCTRTRGGHRRFDPAAAAALAGVPAPRTPLPPWAPDLAARYQAGASVRDCAAHLGIGYGPARMALHKMGIIRGHGGTRGDLP